MVTTVCLTSGTSWLCPVGVTSINVYAIGAGMNGVSGGAGGNGGCFASKLLSVTPGNSYPFQIGLANGAVGPGSASANTWFNSNSTLVAAGGASSTANCIGSTVYPGGAGAGSYGGGGGAAGLYGAGNNGGASGGAGGAGDFGFGGAGGAAGGGNGGNGSEWTATAGGTYGSGGGGGGGNSSAGSAGLYGAGGGAPLFGGVGAGSGGLLVITYTVVVASQNLVPNLAIYPDPYYPKLSAAQGWFTGIESPMQAPPPSMAFYVPFSNPILRKLDSPQNYAQTIFVQNPSNPPEPPRLAFYRPLSDPVLKKVDTPQNYQCFVGIEAVYSHAAIVTLPFGWFLGLSTPVLKKVDAPQNYQYFCGIEFPIPSEPPRLAFYKPFSDPVRSKVDTPENYQCFVGIEARFVYVAPVFNPIGWYQQLSQPVLRKSDAPFSWFAGIEASFSYILIPSHANMIVSDRPACIIAVSIQASYLIKVSEQAAFLITVSDAQ